MLSMNEQAIGRTAKVGIVALILVILIIGAVVYYTQLEKTGGIKSSKPQLAGNFYPITTLGQQLILQINLTSPTNITNANSIELQLSGGGISGVITLTYSSTAAVVSGVAVYYYNSQKTVGANFVNPGNKEVGLKGVNFIENHAYLYIYLSPASGFSSWAGVQITFIDPNYTGTIVYSVPS